MLISLCMIVKNEEKVLERCLDSVSGLADEIIIVDTGSEDRTIEIAKRYTSHIYEFEWINDFAAARNESLRHASGKWVLILDADEYVEKGRHEEIKAALRSIKTNTPQCLLLKIMSFYGDNDQQVYESAGPRLFTNHKGIRYSEPIHEQLICSEGIIQYSTSSITVYHSGYTNQTVAEKKKNQRNMDILRGMESEEKLQDPYYCFVLGNEYSNSGDFEQAYKHYKRSYDNTNSSTVWFAHLMDHLCQATLATHRYKEAHRYIQQGKSLWPECVDYYCMEGVLYERIGFDERAFGLFQQCLDIVERCQTKEIPYWVVKENYGQVIPHQSMAEIARRRGNLHQFVHHLTASIKLDRKNYAALRSLLRTLSLHESVDSVQTFVEKLYPISVPQNAFILFQTSLLECLSELAFHYRNICKNYQIPVAYVDELTYEVLQKNNSALKEGEAGELSSALALLVSVVTRDESYISFAESSAEQLIILYRKIAAALVYDEQVKPLEIEDYSFVVQLLVQLLRFNYMEEYDRILQCYVDSQLLNSLAEVLASLGDLDRSFEFYATLLDNDELQGLGYKQMGRYCFMLGNPTDGLQLLERALQLEPSIDLLGIVVENGVGLDTSAFIRSYMEWIPEDLFPEQLKLELGNF